MPGLSKSMDYQIGRQCDQIAAQLAAKKKLEASKTGTLLSTALVDGTSTACQETIKPS